MVSVMSRTQACSLFVCVAFLLLAAPSAETRAEAARALGESVLPEGLEALVQSLAGDPSKEFRVLDAMPIGWPVLNFGFTL